MLDHLRIFLFQNFFNHGEGNDTEIGQNENHASASSEVHFQDFLQPSEGNSEEIRIIVDHL